MLEVVGDFIRANHLHDNIPVSLKYIEDYFDVRYLPLESCNGFIWRHIIGIKEDLSLPERREIMAHEFCHFLLGHPASLVLCRHYRWWYNKIETDAMHCAAQILIPRAAVVSLATQGCNAPEMAEELQVPLRLLNRAIKTHFPEGIHEAPRFDIPYNNPVELLPGDLARPARAHPYNEQ